MTIYINKNHKTADIGILIGKKSCWGKGMGLDAWNTCITWLFDKKNIRKITAGTLDLNLGMISIMKKSGMQQEAVRSKQEYCNGDYRDILYFSKFND
jgi:RimJ/RimL family protein N-acetyltransferase